MTSFLDYLAKPERPTPAVKVAPAPAGHCTPYARKALEAEVDRVVNAGEGTRNDTLNRAAFSLGQLVGGGEIAERDVVEALVSAAAVAGLESDETFRTIKSGLVSGQDHPRNGSKTWTSTNATLTSPAPTAATGGANTTPPAASPPSEAATSQTTAPAGDVEPSDPPLPPTWGKTDLSGVLDGSYVAPTAALMPRADGVCLLYPGLTHSLHGESESGKSWVAQAEAARCMTAGHDVLYVDFESDAASIVERFLLLGCSKEQIAAHLDYRAPEGAPGAAHELDAWHDMLARPYALAVIDGVTDAMGLFGRSSMDNDDIAAWSRAFPRQLAARTGAAVVMIDHVTKDKETRGRFAIGGQAKMASLTGAGYVVDVHEGLGKGLRGVLVLRVAKDRPGAVRGKSGPMRKTDRTQEAARFVLDSTGAAILVEVLPWEGADGVVKPFRPTHLMERVSKFIEISPGASKAAIERDVQGKADALRIALDMLVSEQNVRREIHGQAVRHYSIRPFREEL